MANTKKPKSLKVKIRTFSCRDDEYDYIKNLDPSGMKSFKSGLRRLLEISGYKPDLIKLSKKD